MDIQPGDFVVYQSYGNYSETRADQVTPKQIKTSTYGRRFSITSRDAILFSGSREKAELVVSALRRAVEERKVAARAAKEAFEIATAPAKAIMEATIEAAEIAAKEAVRTIIEAAK